MKPTINLFNFFFILVAFSHLRVLAVPLEFYNDLENFQQKNLSLDVEKAKLKASEDFHLSKKLFWTPSLSVSTIKAKNTLNGASTLEQDYLQSQISLNLFRGGADLALLNQADAEEKSQNLAVKNEELRIDLLASDLIFKALYLKESLRIQEDLYKLKEESLKVTKERYSSGKTPLQEVTKSEVDLNQQKNKLRLASLTIIENEVSIKSAFIDSVKSQIWPFAENENFSFLSDQTNTQEKNPSVEQKYWDLMSRESSLSAAKRSYWPTIDLSVQFQDSPIKDQTTHQVMSLLTFNFPIWSQFETAVSVSQSKATYLKAEADYRSLEQTARLKKDFLSKKVEIVRLNLIDAKKNLKKSTELYNDLLRSFRLGRLSTNDLLIEQGRFLESASNSLSAQLSYHQTVVESCVLQGIRVRDCVSE